MLERSGAGEPQLLPHVLLRARDVMRERFPRAADRDPVREVGLIMARDDVDLVPVVDGDGRLAGAVTERALARRYVRESREASRLDAPTAVGAIAGVLQGDQLVGDPQALISGRVWVLAMATSSLPMGFQAGDVVVVGDRPDAQRIALEVGVGLLVTTNATAATDDNLALARERGIPVVVSPLDSYVTARMITLSAPSLSLMDREPVAVAPDDLVTDITDDGEGRRLPRRRRGRRRPAPDRPRHALRPRRPRAAQGDARRPRRAGAVRRRASSTPRSSRSSTTTTSARSRRGSRCAPRSTPSAAPRR